MLYLNPPFLTIDGVSVFADHIDPLQFYFMPMMPRLTQVAGADGKLVPQIQLLKFRGQAGTGGFLNFDVNIGLDPDRQAEVKRQLKRLNRLRDEPRLSPVPLIDGTVRMMLFGKQTPDPVPVAPAGGGAAPVPATPPPALPTLPQFVLKIDQAARPALYGDNQAAFSVTLDESGVTLLEQAIKGEMSPVGIIYSLDYLGLRPAYSTRLIIDWDRVQTHMDEKFSVGALFFSADIETVVDELVESRVIQIETDTFVTEDEANRDVLSRRDLAMNEVRDMVTEQFFTASVDPINLNDDVADGIQTAGRLLQKAASHGMGFSYSKVDVRRTDRKKLTVNISERTTVRRTIYPQGHLAGLFGLLRQPGMDLSRFVLSVDLDDPWFQRRQVTVISRANFETDSILSINVRLVYGDMVKNVLLESSSARQSVTWLSLVRNGAFVRPVMCSYVVTFKNANPGERPLRVLSDVVETDLDNVEISPRELYDIAPVPITADRFPWERYPMVELLLRYTDPAHAIAINDRLVLTKEQQTANWSFFLRDVTRRQYSYKLIFRAASLHDVEMPFVETDAEGLTLRDPFPRKRTLLVVPSMSWAVVERLFVDVSYSDPAHAVQEDRSFEFTEAAPNPQTFSVDLLDQRQQLVSFQSTILFKNGSVLEIPRSVTREPRVIVRADMKGHTIVRVSLGPVDFVRKQLRGIVVDVRYEDPAHQLSFGDTFSFSTPTDAAFFEYDYVDPARPAYQFRISYNLTNGLSRTIDWAGSSKPELVIPAP